MGVPVLVGGRRVAVDGISVLVTVIMGWMVGEEVISKMAEATAFVGVEADRLEAVDGLERLQAEKKHPAARR
jgi:hypothetical protein